MDKIDLHTHTIYSDGTCTPEEVVCLAAKANLSAVAITDHDTIGGVKRAKAAGIGKQIEVISGVEFTGEYKGSTIHILGYLFNENSDIITSAVKNLIILRKARNIELIHSLASFGVPVSELEMGKHAPLESLGRTHFALFLTEHGFAVNFDDAFRKFLRPGAKTYVPFKASAAEDVINVIAKAGGVAVLAHATLYGFNREKIEKTVRNLKVMGLAGFECFYPSYKKEDETFLLHLSDKYNLFATGGSDFHGKNREKNTLGCVGTDRRFLELMREYQKAK